MSKFVLLLHVYQLDVGQDAWILRLLWTKKNRFTSPKFAEPEFIDF